MLLGFLRVIKLVLNKILIYWNLLIFSYLYYFIGISSAYLYLERVSKLSIIPILKRYGASIGENCDIETGITFHSCSNFNKLTIGRNCHIGKKCFFDLKGSISIEDNVVISMKTKFITHQDLSKSVLCKIYPKKKAGIVVGEQSYVGADSTILMGVVIGVESIIGANSLVNKRVAKNTIVAGVPAKAVKNRV